MMRFSVVSLCMVIVAVAVSGCHRPLQNNLPPAAMLMHPGPGVDGPGPGVLMPGPPGAATTGRSSQVYFVGPTGMIVTWDVGGAGLFDSDPLICPGRYNFPQGYIFRLKLTNIEGREGVELYPTVEIGPAVPRIEAFLAHNAIPIQFSPEDFDQVITGNFVTKVIYLPDPEFQDLAMAGVETLVSTRLDPGVDPIVEADRQGAILAIIRLGNKDLAIPGEAAGGGGVSQVGYMQGQAMTVGPRPLGSAVGGGGSIPTHHISGVNMPQYGMPMSGTPIGLVGPPHVPLGIPAGLQRHSIKNHTRVHIPSPTSSIAIDVKQKPGFSYPKPASRVKITERTLPGFKVHQQPFGDKHEIIKPSYGGQYQTPAY